MDSPMTELQELAWNSGSRQLNSGNLSDQTPFVPFRQVTGPPWRFLNSIQNCNKIVEIPRFLQSKPPSHESSSSYIYDSSHSFYECDRGWITKKLPIWNFWNKCCGSVVALIYGKPGSGSPQSHSFFPHEMGHTKNCQFLFYNSWGYIGSSQSNSCKLSFSKISSCLRLC